MGIFGKIFKNNKSTDSKPAMSIDLAVQKEKEFLGELLKQDIFQDNYEVECLAQVLINETAFLIDSQRIPQHQKTQE